MQISFKSSMLFIAVITAHVTVFGQLVRPSRVGNAPKATPITKYDDGDKDEKPADNTPQSDEEISLKIKAGTKNSIFDEATYIKYKVDIKSTYKSKQDGDFTYVVLTDDGKKLFEKTEKLHLGRKGSKTMSLKMPPNPPGFYQLSIRMNLTDYDDTVRKVFGVAPDKIVAQEHRPADFDAFWQKSKDALAKIAPDYKITEQKDRSTKDIKVYLVEMRSWGNAVIRGWLTIPVKKDRLIPIRYRVPGYLVEMQPSMIEDDFAVFQLNVRGNGNSKDALPPFVMQYNNIRLDSRDNYIYRAVYMDCIRGLDFLASHGNMGIDVNRISIDGGSQGGCLAVVVASLDKRIKLVTTEVPLYSDLRDASRITRLSPPAKETPVFYLNNYVKTHPGTTYEDMYKIWDYYDPLNFAPRVECPVLMGIGLMDELCPPSCSVAMYNRLGTTKKELWVSADKAHELDPIYYRFQYNWLREYFLLP